jgi:hypothetical protein
MIALPIAVMPDLVLGGNGALRTVDYPADWDRVAATLRVARGEVLVLPFSAYRGFAWNNGRTSIDPATRYFPGDVLVDDTLVVGDLTVEGEDARARRVRELIADGRPIVPTGVRWVVVEHHVGETVSDTQLSALRLVHSGRELSLYENPGWRPGRSPSTARWLVVAAVIGAFGLTLVAVLRLLRTPTTW